MVALAVVLDRYCEIESVAIAVYSNRLYLHRTGQRRLEETMKRKLVLSAIACAFAEATPRRRGIA